MALAAYLTQTGRLLQNPGAPTPLYSPTDLTSYINTSRGQLAGDSETIRFLATITTVPGQRNYNFSSLNLGVSATNGIQGVLNVRRIMYGVGSGQRWIRPRSWPWFDLYKLNTPVPPSGAPTVWAQYAQGSTGSFYLDPIPDIPYSLQLDCVCYPIPLVTDGTVEAIPYIWTDAVPFFAAYYALLSSQTSARIGDAERMFGYYQTFVQRAREMSNPSVNRFLYEQAGDPTQASKLGIKAPAGGGG